jgi:rod shape-determining protein MreC
MRIRSLSLFRRYSLVVFIILLLFSALVLMSYRMKQKKGMDFLDAFLLEVCAPVQKAATLMIKTVHDTFQSYIFLTHVHQENVLLKQKVAALQEENQQMKEVSLANERLRRLFQFREKISSSMIASEVIGQDPTSWFKSVTIDKGEKDGVRQGMAVISPEGVVGQILKSSSHYATVLLITDYNSAVDAFVRRTRAKAIVEGMGENRCQLKYLLRVQDVVVGDIVVSSGLGGNFPKGLLVGEIKKVEKDTQGIFQYAELAPSVDLTRLEEVFVITESPPYKAQEEKEKKVGKPPAGGRKKK